MTNIKIKWKYGSFYELRRQRGVQEALERTAKRIANACNKEAGTDEFKISSQQGARKPQGRWRTTVITAGVHAARHNAKHQTLIRNLTQEGKRL